AIPAMVAEDPQRSRRQGRSAGGHTVPDQLRGRSRRSLNGQPATNPILGTCFAGRSVASEMPRGLARACSGAIEESDSEGLMSTRASTVIDGESILTSAGTLGPAIEAAADDIARDRRLPADLVESMRRAGIFRIAFPRAWGGPEMDI